MSNIIFPDNKVNYYEYNENMQLRKIHYSGVSGDAWASYFEYDNASRLSGIQHWKGANWQLRFDLTRNAKGLVTEYDCGYIGVSPSLHSLEYDNRDQLDYEGWLSGQTPLYAFYYEYDDDMNRKFRRENSDLTYYTIDNERITQLDGNYGGGITYYAWDNQGQASFTQKLEDNLVTMFAFNDAHRVKMINQSGPTNFVYFDYDGLGRLYCLRDSDGWTYFAYDSDNFRPTVELDSMLNEKVRYSWGPSPFPGLSIVAVARKASGPTYQFPLTDHLGSTHHVIDDSGNPLSYFEYEAFGTKKLETQTTNFPYQHTHVRALKDYPLYFHPFRLRDSKDGRWLSPDPVKRIAESPYQYANNSPLPNIDIQGATPKSSKDDLDKTYNSNVNKGDQASKPRGKELLDQTIAACNTFGKMLSELATHSPSKPMTIEGFKPSAKSIAERFGKDINTLQDIYREVDGHNNLLGDIDYVNKIQALIDKDKAGAKIDLSGNCINAKYLYEFVNIAQLYLEFVNAYIKAWTTTTEIIESEKTTPIDITRLQKATTALQNFFNNTTNTSLEYDSNYYYYTNTLQQENEAFGLRQNVSDQRDYMFDIYSERLHKKLVETIQNVYGVYMAKSVASIVVTWICPMTKIKNNLSYIITNHKEKQRLNTVFTILVIQEIQKELNALLDITGVRTPAQCDRIDKLLKLAQENNSWFYAVMPDEEIAPYSVEIVNEAINKEVLKKYDIEGVINKIKKTKIWPGLEYKQ